MLSKGYEPVHLLMDIEFSLLKTSYGMKKRFEYFGESFKAKLYGKKESDKVLHNLEAIKLYYNVSTRVAKQYYDLICSINKGQLIKIRKSVGME